jgi:PII-like signaling protein
VIEDGLKLTTYLGERDRIDGGFATDALAAVYARHDLQASILLRGAAGFGPGRHLRTDRQLTLSEDLPLVSVAVDARPRIERALAEVEALRFAGLVTIERARLLTAPLTPVPAGEPGESVKLTAYFGRQERLGRAPAWEAVVALLHRRGVAGATVLLGVDGTAHGTRRRATLLGGNAEVPLMVIAVGDAKRVDAVLPELGALLVSPVVTLERVRVRKRDGERLPATEPVPQEGAWQKLTIYSGEQSRHKGRPLHLALLGALRDAGAAGATCVRGIWGYHGDHAPHGDTFWQLRRRVPVVTVVVDAPDRARDWLAVVDEHTRESGLVTSEMVPRPHLR